MSFSELLIVNYVELFINGLGILYSVHILFNKKITLTKPLLVSYPLFIGAICLMCTIITHREIEKQGYYSAELALIATVIEIVILILYCTYLFGGNSIKKLFPSILVAYVLDSICYYVSIFMATFFFSRPLEISVYYGAIVFSCVAVITTMYLISKTKTIIYFRELLKMGNMSIFITLIFFILFLGFEYYATSSVTYHLIALTIIGVSCILFLSIGLISRDFYNKQQLRQSEALLLQQQHYVSLLENTQQKLRTFQHDYKNMVSGLYAQADEGNTEAVKEYINNKILNIDSDIQADIRQTNQLTKIISMELKGLLLVKLMEAKKADVTMDLEVLYEVRVISIDTSDLVRLMGILLDNAIEGVQNTATRNVSIAILQEDDKTTIIVKNAISDKVNISDIWKNGYSTKGTNRGLGLSSYKKILSNYDNAFCETKIEDNQFIQILVVT